MATFSTFAALSLVVIGCSGDWDAVDSSEPGKANFIEALGAGGLSGGAGQGSGGSAGLQSVVMRWEVEQCPVLDKTPTTTTSTLSGSSYSNQLALRAVNPSGVGSYVTFRASSSVSGLSGTPVRLLLRALATVSAAQIKLSTAPSDSGPWTDFAPVDLFSGSIGPTTFDLGVFTFNTAQPYFMATVVGKNPTSSGYGFTLDYLDVRSP